MKRINVNLDWMQVFVIINKRGIKINSGVYANNWLTLVHAIKEFIWNPSNCECKYNKSCDVAEYLDYESCNGRKSLVDKLVEECVENIDESKIAEITSIELHST